MRHLSGHDSIGSLDIEDNLASLAMLHYDSHAFRLGTKWEVLQNVVFICFTVRVLELDIQFFSCDKFHTELFSKLDQSNFIRTTCLKVLDRLVISVRVDRCDVVAQGQRQDQITEDKVLVLSSLLFIWFWSFTEVAVRTLVHLATLE